MIVRSMDASPSLYWDLAQVHRIAVFRALHLGDFIAAVPALRALKSRFPHAELTLIGLPWTRSILSRFSHIVDRFLPFPGYRQLEGVGSDNRKTEEYFQAARGYRYDLAVQMHGDGRISNGFVAGLGARISLGYRPPASDCPERLSVEMEHPDSLHEIHRWLRLVRLVGATGTPSLEFPVLPEDRAALSRLAMDVGLDLGRRLLVLHPGSKTEDKRWPEERFSDAATVLAAALGCQVAITGNQDERDLAQRVADRAECQPLVLAGRTSLGMLAALMGKTTLLITNDSGPSHLAAALGTPSVVLFGPTDPARWAPLDRQLHRVIWPGRNRPMSDIATGQVIEESLSVVT